ncbi:membrane protein of unknown function [Methylorubrum extorquens]|uniref:ABC transmembrane type-1 domain-containing protein n=1 Tax=Methylorubrum extorquens TaxID=408 RepID=A0A2N9AVE1_METEX|nr:membrane protein of unknown function [Methylorubrum extorquens]
MRLFALLRTGARYGERMAGHRAALSDQIRRRAGLFAALARAPESRGAGWQLGRPERLADFIDDVADIDYARLRVGFPLAMTGAALAGLVLATALVAPLALLPAAVLALAGGLVARHALTRLAAIEAWVRRARRNAAADLGAALAGAVPLDAEGRRGPALRIALDPLRDAEREAACGKRALARLEAVLALAGPALALAVLLAAWSAGARGTGLLPAAFLAFTWLALAEPILSPATGAARLRPRPSRPPIPRRGGGRRRGTGPPARSGPRCPDPARFAPADAGRARVRPGAGAGRRARHAADPRRRQRLRQDHPAKGARRLERGAPRRDDPARRDCAAGGGAAGADASEPARCGDPVRHRPRKPVRARRLRRGVVGRAGSRRTRRAHSRSRRPRCLDRRGRPFAGRSATPQPRPRQLEPGPRHPPR